MNRICDVPFCHKNTPRSKDRFCSSHRNEFFVRKITPYKELIPWWSLKLCKKHGYLSKHNVYHHKTHGLYICSICTKEQLKIKYNPDKQRQYKLKQQREIKNRYIKCKYGITLNDYESLLKNQNFGCAICFTKNPGRKYFDIDHCHESKAVRGLLCHQCNVALGFFKDSKENLERAIIYLS